MDIQDKIEEMEKTLKGFIDEKNRIVHNGSLTDEDRYIALKSVKANISGAKLCLRVYKATLSLNT